MFVPQKDLSGDQAYWLSANEIATPFVHKSRPPSQVLASLQKVNVVFHQFEEIREFEQIFDDLDAEYEQCVIDNKNLTIEKKAGIGHYSNCLCEDLRSACDREHTKVLELEAECIDISSASNAIFEINKLRQQLQRKDDTIRNLDAQISIMKVLNV
ncbi:hypothetical protein Tco_0118712, partial [Tanacetum coccineum]